MRRVERSPKAKLKLLFIVVVAIILIVTIAAIVLLEYFIIQTRLLSRREVEDSGLFYIIMFGAASTIIGLLLAVVFSKKVLNPVNELMEGLSKLSNGDFNTRIDIKSMQDFKVLSEEFNALATELQNTEILRSDFVNNFSHELKTPIVSISGLISLLKNDKLPEDKRKKYLEIIDEEVNRLAQMTTNMLNLSRVEKQEILTDKTFYNVSEQIRNCVLLLEKKWEKKSIEFSLDFDEINIFASEDLMKQVWLNLLDNAIKFSDDKGVVEIKIEQKSNSVVLTFVNGGKVVSEDELSKIFNKFYRGKDVQQNEGNGIGLSIVKRIVDLHGGQATAQCLDGKIFIEITIPKKY